MHDHSLQVFPGHAISRNFSTNSGDYSEKLHGYKHFLVCCYRYIYPSLPKCQWWISKFQWCKQSPLINYGWIMIVCGFSWSCKLTHTPWIYIPANLLQRDMECVMNHQAKWNFLPMKQKNFSKYSTTLP